MIRCTVRRCLPLVLLLALASTACDDATGPIQPAGDLEITLAPIALSLQPGGTAGVEVNVIRSGDFAGDVTVRVTGLPAGVTAAPLTIPAPDRFGTLRLEAALSAGAGASTVSVTASGASVDDAAADQALTVGGGIAPG